MRSDTLIRFLYPFEYWEATTTGTETTWAKARDDTGLLIPVSGGGVYLICREPMDTSGIVRNLRDPRGNEVFTADDEEYDMFVQTVEPQFDFFGVIIAHKHTLRRTLPPAARAAALGLNI